MEYQVKDLLSIQMNPDPDDVQKMIVDLKLNASPTPLTFSVRQAAGGHGPFKDSVAASPTDVIGLLSSEIEQLTVLNNQVISENVTLTNQVNVLSQINQNLTTQLTQDVSESTQDINELNNKASDLANQISSMSAQIDALNSEIATYQTQSQNDQSNVTALTNEITQLKNSITQIVSDDDNKIFDLQDQLTTVTEQLAAANAQIAAMQSADQQVAAWGQEDNLDQAWDAIQKSLESLGFDAEAEINRVTEKYTHARNALLAARRTYNSTILDYHYDKEQLIDAMLRHIIEGIKNSDN